MNGVQPTQTNTGLRRTPGAAWYDNYIVIVSAVAVAVVGMIYMLLLRPHEKGDAPAGDAVPAAPAAAPASP